MFLLLSPEINLMLRPHLKFKLYYKCVITKYIFWKSYSKSNLLKSNDLTLLCLRSTLIANWTHPTGFLKTSEALNWLWHYINIDIQNQASDKMIKIRSLIRLHTSYTFFNENAFRSQGHRPFSLKYISICTRKNQNENGLDKCWNMFILFSRMMEKSEDDSAKCHLLKKEFMT